MHLPPLGVSTSYIQLSRVERLTDERRDIGV